MEGPNHYKLRVKDILPELKEIVPESHSLGIQLIEVHELKKIESNFPTDVDRQMSGVIEHWQCNTPCPTWETLAKAVDKVGGHSNLVQRLKELHQQAISGSIEIQTAAAYTARKAVRLSDRPQPQEMKKYVLKHVGEKWEELAVHLGLDEDEENAKKLEDIRKKRQDKASLAANDVLMMWQRCDQAEPSWEKLIEALEMAELNDAAKSVKDYLGDNGDTNSQLPPPSRVQPTALAMGGQQLKVIPAPAADAHHMPSASKYAVQMKPGQSVRMYQHELAAPGIRGENYIVVAPTNSGKTLVVALIIADHLEKKKGQKMSPRVAVVVKTRPLADQQCEKLAEYIPKAVVECRTGNRGSVEERQRQLHIKDALVHANIIVCTAGKILNEFKTGMVTLSEFSLMIVDECHNTEKNSNYAQIMHMYLQQKVKPNRLPQVVGLTATPGIGRNPGLNPSKVIEDIITLCAYMNATGGIQTVQEYTAELNDVVRKPEFFQEVVNQNEQREAFIQRIEEDMKEYENFLKLNLSKKLPRWSQKYEQAVQECKIALEESESPNVREEISTVGLLLLCSQVLICYMELPCAHALCPIDEYDELVSSEKNSLHEKYLLEKFTQLKLDLVSLNICENPTLVKMEDRLTYTFKRNPKSEGIVFVRTREQAEAIHDWISESNFAELLGLRSSMLLGHKRPEDKGPSMSDEEQKMIVDGFKSGIYNLLIATSVAEEGLDIKQCNLVMRLHISSARAKAQMQGRARAEDSEIVTIVSNDSKKLYQDMLNDELLLLMEMLIKNGDLVLPIDLQERIERKQNIIQDDIKRQRELQEARLSTHPAHNVELRCKKCKKPAGCRGSDIYQLDNTGHHVVPGGVLNYEPVKHARPGIVDGCGNLMIKKLYKVHCMYCPASWGVLGTWPSKKEFPILKCESFNFYVDGRQVRIPKWKEKRFTVLPLSKWLETNELKVMDQ